MFSKIWQYIFATKNNEILFMTDKFRKIEKWYVLSDSSVNEYGFRLITEGYQIDAFKKNPIGYYMHRREDGIALKWEDILIENDTISAVPVINLANQRGEQICNEAENGFLNAASMGHIVVLEYSTDPEMLLPGQTGPTVTKWYNKECSLVDIPGNTNALTKLYDEQENEINLADFGSTNSIFDKFKNGNLKAIASVLNLEDFKDEKTVIEAINNLATKANSLEAENLLLNADKNKLQQKLDDLVGERTRNEINALLERALEDRKITVELKAMLLKDYEQNAEGLKKLLGAMPAYRSIAENLKSRMPDKSEAEWSWDDYEKNDPTGKKLKDLRANDAVRYKELFDRKFGV